MSRAAILLLEDDAILASSIADLLHAEGFEASLARDGEHALEASYKQRFDLYLFDIKTPNIDGIELLSRLRESGDVTPAIFLTSYKEKPMLYRGYEAGCDDYIKKPFDPDELLLKIGSLLKRSRNMLQSVRIGTELVFDMERLVLMRKEQEVGLSKMESRLLFMLLKNRGRVVAKEEIEDFLWGSATPSSALRVYISALKREVGKGRITNIRGIGYRFENPEG